MANNVDPDQTPRSAASDLGLHCLLSAIYLSTLGKFKVYVTEGFSFFT